MHYLSLVFLFAVEQPVPSLDQRLAALLRDRVSPRSDDVKRASAELEELYQDPDEAVRRQVVQTLGRTARKARPWIGRTRELVVLAMLSELERALEVSILLNKDSVLLLEASVAISSIGWRSQQIDKTLAGILSLWDRKDIAYCAACEAKWHAGGDAGPLLSLFEDRTNEANRLFARSVLEKIEPKPDAVRKALQLSPPEERKQELGGIPEEKKEEEEPVPFWKQPVALAGGAALAIILLVSGWLWLRRGPRLPPVTASRSATDYLENLEHQQDTGAPS